MKKLLSFDEARDAKMDDAPIMVAVVAYVDGVRFLFQGALILWAVWFALALVGIAFGVVIRPQGWGGIVVGTWGLAVLMSPGPAVLIGMRFYDRRRIKWAQSPLLIKE